MSTHSVPTASVSPSDASTSQPLHVYLAGVGAVGTALLRQMEERSGAAPALRLLGACTSRRAAWVEAGRGPRAVRSGAVDAQPLDWAAIRNRLTSEAPRPLVFVDATGSPEVAEYYEPLLRAGIHVVTPSKIANTQSQAAFDRLRSVASEQGVQYRYETTVGAGLPVVQTVQNLVETGDRVRTIRGAASGTLTYLFAAIRDGASFSAAVRAAIDRGYAEPDVRDDLSGTDVARKFLILARTAGRSIEPDDVQVESLVPSALEDQPYEAFLERLRTVNEHWEQRTQTAAADDAVLQYIGRLSSGGIEVGVQAVPRTSAFGRLQGQENLFEITTDRYATVPLSVRGPGAGPEVTAAGVLADVLAVARTQSS